nr:hypothetical protein [Cupriavidus sp. TA19]
MARSTNGVQQPATVFEPQRTLEAHRRHRQRLVERAFELAPPQPYIARDGIKRRRVVDALLDKVGRLAYARILDMGQVGIEMRLRQLGRPHPLQHHVAHRLLRLLPSAMARNEIQPQVNGRGRPGTGNQVAFVNLA